MRLVAAARHFDHLTMVDAYTSEFVGYGQFMLFDDSVRDGAAIERRVISTVPSLSMPPRRVVKAGDLHWIVGDFFPDFFRDETIRKKYVATQSSGLSTVKTVQEALTEAPGVLAHVGVHWSRAAKEVDESSGLYSLYDLIFATGEPVAQGNLVSLAGRWYLVRTTYLSASGFLTVVADALYEPVFETVSYTAKAYNPVTDAYAATAVNVKVLRLRWQSDFEYLTQATDRYLPGDVQVLMPKGVVASPKAGDALPLSEGAHRVLSVRDEGTYLSLHARRA